MTTDDGRDPIDPEAVHRAERIIARLQADRGSLAADTADTTEAEAAKLRAERQKLQADRKRWNEFDLKTVQRFESERDQARADLAALRDKVRALADDLPARTHGVDDAGIAKWRERDKVSYKIAIEEAQVVIRALLTDGD